MNIYQRLAKVREEVKHVRMREVDRANVQFAGFREYKGHDDVTAALQGAYLRHGIHREVTMLEWQRVDHILSMRVRVSWVNIDDPQDRSTVESLGESILKSKAGFTSSDKQSGIALSYALKMAELKCLCLTGDDTPDAEVSSPGQVDPEDMDAALREKLDRVQLQLIEGDSVAVDTAIAFLKGNARSIPRAVLDDFRRLAGEAKERLRNG